MPISFTDSLKKTFKKAFDFETRSSRSEYWYFLIFVNVGIVVTWCFDNFFGLKRLPFIQIPTEEFIYIGYLGYFTIFFLMLVAIPAYAVQVRRAHDINLSGWLILAQFLPYIGLISIIFFGVQKSYKGKNKFGEPDY